MPHREPVWWYAPEAAWQARVLAPLGWLYGAAAKLRFAVTRPHKAGVPVLCVGNFTAGGTGKTPFAIALAQIVRGLDREPVFLSRGYGGTARGPLIVECVRHTHADVGDEPLLLSRAAPTIVSRDRAEGADFIARTFGAKAVIIMDDGLQNPSLHKDLAIALVDTQRRFGNGCCLPAGPLRAPLAFQSGLVQAIAVSGSSNSKQEQRQNVLGGLYSGPVLAMHTEPSGDNAWLKGARVLAYSGIANPARFFASLEGLGAVIAVRRIFGDHHAFSDREARELLEAAQSQGLQLVTTEKDHVRLAGGGADLAALREASRVLTIHTVLEDASRAQLIELITKALSR